jgi:hypothetical protein
MIKDVLEVLSVVFLQLPPVHMAGDVLGALRQEGNVSSEREASRTSKRTARPRVLFSTSSTVGNIIFSLGLPSIDF